MRPHGEDRGGASGNRPGPSGLVAIAAIFAVCLALGWALTRRPPPPEPAREAEAGGRKSRIDAFRMRGGKTSSTATRGVAPDAQPPGTVAGEAVLRFSSDEALQRFLAHPPRGLKVLAFEPRLRAVRVAVGDPAALEALRAAGDTGIEFNFIVSTPEMPDPREVDALGPGAPFGNGALAWLGADGRPAGWGQGVTVAILDSGVQSHPALAGATIRSFNLLGGTAAGEASAHGTAVASLLAGSSADVPGVAPGVDILDLRILDGNGTGDSFTLATGILRAVDLGAQVISLSLGMYGDSPMVRDAVTYALSRNVAIVAAAGNDGLSAVTYPARYPGVIAVSAVDATGHLASFSNSGEGMSIAAPGAALNAAWSGGQIVSFSGTSAAVPLVTGAIAYLLADERFLTPAAAAAKLLLYTDEAGAPGQDPEFGTGILDLGRLQERRTQSIFDLALASHWIDTASALDGATVPVLVTIQNRGTTAASSVSINVSAGGIHETFQTLHLAPGAISTHSIDVPASLLSSDEPLTIESSVSRPGIKDVRPANNRLRSSLLLTE